MATGVPLEWDNGRDTAVTGRVGARLWVKGYLFAFTQAAAWPMMQKSGAGCPLPLADPSCEAVRVPRV